MIAFKNTFSRRELLWFGPLFALFAGLVAAMAWWKFGAPRFAQGAGIVAAVIILVYYLLPPLRRLIFMAWLGAVYPLGWTLSHLLLAVVFYLVVLPIGLLLRLFRYDALRRRFEPGTPSYWIRRGPPRGPESYFRQL